jgi:arylformamidase
MVPLSATAINPNRKSGPIMNIIDITMELMDPRGTFTGDPQASVVHDKRIYKGDRFNTSLITCSSHTGTHIDVPFHFRDDGATLSSVGLQVLCGDTYVAEMEDGAFITAANLDEANIDKNTSRLLLKSSHGSDRHLAGNNFRPRGLDSSGTDWIIKNGIKLVGVESMTIEPPDHYGFDVHKQLLSRNIVILEGLELEQVQTGRYMLYCLPLKIGEVDGAPVRAILVSD